MSYTYAPYSKEMLEKINNDLAEMSVIHDRRLVGALLNAHPITRELHKEIGFPNELQVEKVDKIIRKHYGALLP